MPVPLSGQGNIVYTCMSILRGMQAAEFDVELIAPRANRSHRAPFVRTRLPPALNRLPWRLLRRSVTPAVERMFERRLRPGDIAYLWSETSLDLAERLRSRGAVLLREKTNAHKATAKARLDVAYAAAGMAPAHGITEQRIAKERAELALADFVFSASPCVTESLVDNGVRRAAILESSYGWEAGRIHGTGRRLLPTAEGMTICFVGDVSVGKGVPTLLEAWRRAGVRGRLLLAGRPEEGLRAAKADLFRQPGVSLLGFVNDIGALYRSADIFAFPSHTEGGPLVTYEAMSCGLPVITSPMGAGAIGRDGVNSLVRDPLRADEWAEAFVRLSEDADLRRRLADRGREDAERFTWTRVGAERRALILEGKSRVLGGPDRRST